MTGILLHRGLVVVAGATAIAVAFCCLGLGSARAEDAAKGEFSDACAMGLASGQMVKTDCSVNWTAPDGKVYCFSTEESKTALLKNPDENLQKAKEFLLAEDLAADTTAAPTSPADAAAPAPSEQPAAEEGGLVKPSAKEFTEDDVNKALADVLAKRSKDGVFVFHDPKLDEDLNLVFEKTKIVRGMTGYGWFDNAIFHDKDEPKKQYAIDFWFKPDGDQLKLMDIRVQKGPKQEGDGWVMITRMPVAWWWLPVQEHPGDTEVTRAWQVMAAIHKYIADHKDANGDLDVKDPKGNSVPLQFVEIHQPVRHLKKEGEYFVCTDFRKPGSTDEYYDIDFWVNQKTGKLEVDNVKMHKVPVQEDGVWTQKPLYTFDGMDFDVTN